MPGWVTIPGRFNRIESLPAEIGKLAALRELHMEGNKLAALPPEVQQHIPIHQQLLVR